MKHILKLAAAAVLHLLARLLVHTGKLGMWLAEKLVDLADHISKG